MKDIGNFLALPSAFDILLQFTVNYYSMQVMKDNVVSWPLYTQRCSFGIYEKRLRT